MLAQVQLSLGLIPGEAERRHQLHRSYNSGLSQGPHPRISCEPSDRGATGWRSPSAPRGSCLGRPPGPSPALRS
jgi:hypothetical protein